MPSPIVHFQLASPDPEAVSTFCREVFEWDVTPGQGRITANLDTGAGQVVPNDIHPLGSVLQLPEGAQPYTSVFVRVADLDATLLKATARGATVLVKPNYERPGATTAIIATPLGINFGIIQL